MEKVGHVNYNKPNPKASTLPQEFYTLFSELKKIGELILRASSPAILNDEFEKYKKRAKKLSTNYFIPSLEILKNFPDIQQKQAVINYTATINNLFESLELGSLLNLQKAQRTVSRETVKEMLPFIKEYILLTEKVVSKKNGDVNSQAKPLTMAQSAFNIQFKIETVSPN